MDFTDSFDSITLEQLRESGTTKWNRADGAIGVFMAEMDFGAPHAVTEALHREVDRGDFAYLPPRHRAMLRQATQDYLARRTGWDVPQEHIHEMPDVVAAYQAVISHFTPAGSKIIVPTPSYMPFLSVPPLLGREVIEVPMVETDGHFTHDLEAIERAFDDGGHLLVLCNPHNPTGRVFTREELEELAEVVERKGGRVFSDEIWLPIIYPGQRHIPYASIGPVAAGHTVTATAASKGFNIPGLKCAQLITSNQEDLDHWTQVGHFPMHGAANLGLVATAAAYEHGEDWLNGVLPYLLRNRDALLETVRTRMPQARVTTPEGTYVAWLDLRSYGIEGSLQEFFLDRAGVMCTEGTACGAVGAGHVRFVFAMPQPLMLEALERMAVALEEHAPA